MGAYFQANFFSAFWLWENGNDHFSINVTHGNKQKSYNNYLFCSPCKIFVLCITIPTNSRGRCFFYCLFHQRKPCLPCQWGNLKIITLARQKKKRVQLLLARKQRTLKLHGADVQGFFSWINIDSRKNTRVIFTNQFIKGKVTKNDAVISDSEISYSEVPKTNTYNQENHGLEWTSSIKIEAFQLGGSMKYHYARKI